MSQGGTQNAKMMAAAGITSGVAFLYSSMKGRGDARRQAMKDTVTWAKGLPKAPGLEGAYDHYTDRLAEIKTGTRPVSRKQFADLLQANGL